jgi:hypothetical protein
VLVDHADAQRPRRRGAGHLHRLAVEAHRALVGPHRTVDDLHQRALARAVLTEHGVDLAGLDAQAHAVIGLDRWILLADVLEFEPVHEELGDGMAAFKTERNLPRASADRRPGFPRGRARRRR